MPGLKEEETWGRMLTVTARPGGKSGRFYRARCYWCGEEAVAHTGDRREAERIMRQVHGFHTTGLVKHRTNAWLCPAHKGNTSPPGDASRGERGLASTEGEARMTPEMLRETVSRYALLLQIEKRRGDAAAWQEEHAVLLAEANETLGKEEVATLVVAAEDYFEQIKRELYDPRLEQLHG